MSVRETKTYEIIYNYLYMLPREMSEIIAQYILSYKYNRVSEIKTDPTAYNIVCDNNLFLITGSNNVCVYDAHGYKKNSFRPEFQIFDKNRIVVVNGIIYMARGHMLSQYNCCGENVGTIMMPEKMIPRYIASENKIIYMLSSEGLVMMYNVELCAFEKLTRIDLGSFLSITCNMLYYFDKEGILHKHNLGSNTDRIVSMCYHVDKIIINSDRIYLLSINSVIRHDDMSGAVENIINSGKIAYDFVIFRDKIIMLTNDTVEIYEKMYVD